MRPLHSIALIGQRIALQRQRKHIRSVVEHEIAHHQVETQGFFVGDVVSFQKFAPEFRVRHLLQLHVVGHFKRAFVERLRHAPFVLIGERFVFLDDLGKIVVERLDVLLRIGEELGQI